MKILFILPQIPYPPHSGGRIVTWNTVKRFAQTDDISVVCLYHNESELTDLKYLEEICHHVAAFPGNAKWSFPVLLRSLFSTWPYKAHRFYNPEMAQHIQHLVKTESYDVIHSQNFYTAAYVRGDEPALKIHYKENLEGRILTRYAVNHKNPLIKLAAALEGERTRRYELRSCRKFDQVLSISPLDRDAIRQMDSSISIEHQSSGVDLEEYPFLDEPAGSPKIVFTGTLSYYPNDYGIQTFLQTAWPIVRKKIPNLECWIVGAGPSKDVMSYHGHTGIHITGWVEDIQHYIDQALIYIVPLEIGGGIRLKILEAMASGRAIVSTAIGCEGLDIIPDVHLKVAEMPEAFAEAIVQLIQQPTLRQQLRQNARSLIEGQYDWDQVIHRQRQRYHSLLPAGEFPNLVDS